MCRRNQLLAVALLAFGAGLLVCGWIDTKFMRWVLGIGLVAAGLYLLQKK
ncbi:MAG: hypothetical protein IJB11_03630 [Oscillospiraceae bacterium]|nr:hypothetical protein [Oscillospiraceae bacterium]